MNITSNKQDKTNILRLLLPVFCVVVWALLSFYEWAQLVRIDAQSLFLFDDLFFKTSVKSPAGFLGYLGTFLTQFLYYPPLGAAIFVALLAVVYWLSVKAFRIPGYWRWLAIIPLFAILALNTQLGYWIYYLKHPGYWFVPVLGTIVGLSAIWLFNKASYKWHIPIVLVWTILGFPLFGFYALVSALCMAVIALSMAVRNGNRMRLVFDGVAVILLALVLIYEVPIFWYDYYSTTAIEYMHTAGLPSYHWDITAESFTRSILPYWVPYVVLFLFQLVMSALYNAFSGSPVGAWKRVGLPALSIVCLLYFSIFYWYRNTNFRVENKQDMAMWESDWKTVAELGYDSSLPSRQIVLNRNIALLNMNQAGEKMFTYPDGSADIDAPMKVHLTHTGGLMSYWCYGKFNFCYRWCVENAVEHGWKVEYLKHAVRSMLLNGEYTLAKRYINILKHTLFHKDWAVKYEKFANNPEYIEKNPEFALPLRMCVYPDILDVDESFVEAYLLNNISHGYTTEHSPVFAEAALMSTLIRKDVKNFWNNLSRYFYKRKIMRLPTHYQEAVLLFSNLSRGEIDVSRIPIDQAVNQRFKMFMNKTKKYKGMKEQDMASHFKDDFGDTYWYFYFFIRSIKTN